MHSSAPHSSTRLRTAAWLAALVLSLGSCADLLGPDREEARLVFVRDSSYDTLLLANADDGSIEERIALPRPAGRFRISPRGDRIAFADGARLSVMNMDGSDLLQLAVNASNAAWSPDGMRLAYVRIPGNELRIVDSYGGADVVVPGAVPGGYLGLAWSPGGGRIAFDGMRGGYRTIFVVNVDGTELRDFDLGVPGPESRASGEPTWSPNGRELAFSRFIRTDAVTVQTALWVATPATGQARRITTPGRSSDVRPSWSPEGDRIAFLRFDGDRSEVYVVRFDGTGLRRITRTPTIREEDPQWMRRR